MLETSIALYVPFRKVCRLGDFKLHAVALAVTSSLLWKLPPDFDAGLFCRSFQFPDVLPVWIPINHTGKFWFSAVPKTLLKLVI